MNSEIYSEPEYAIPEVSDIRELSDTEAIPAVIARLEKMPDKDMPSAYIKNLTINQLIAELQGQTQIGNDFLKLQRLRHEYRQNNRKPGPNKLLARFRTQLGRILDTIEVNAHLTNKSRTKKNPSQNLTPNVAPNQEDYTPQNTSQQPTEIAANPTFIGRLKDNITQRILNALEKLHSK